MNAPTPTTHWADFYRSKGWNPLPSSLTEKRPVIKYSHLWDRQLKAKEFRVHSTGNIQVMVGRVWGLVAIDLDGPEAIEHFATLGPTPRTWAVHSGGDGRHLWFSVPRAGPRIPKAILWRGEGRHSAIERLGDKSLVMAPPSIHPVTGEMYRFLSRAESPARLAVPAPCPNWILRIRPIPAEPRPRPTARFTPRNPLVAGRGRGLDYFADRVELARSWGLRVVGPARESGWVPCRAIDREDRRASAAIHSMSGYYVDSGTGARLKFAELAVALGAYFSVEEAYHALRGQPL